ncbi:S10 family peptidase [Parapedobacter koreensis]|uniref:Carboxypeptidase C (Cathepsin A) n=1 Tax=Parapedobacter koreensis TaxID=332977 RepID=A0A1H7RTP3_9SPHI|nr:carboxypeptidase [Parapedobacter koreensis]SEL62787.1 Carboxypeptidase C (cathepsin A) [Parapedobacter koreensis]
MKKLVFILALFAAHICQAQDRSFNPDSAVTTSHQVTINGQTVKFNAVTGMQPVWDEAGKVIAGVFYTYYYRTDVTNQATRPLAISFNGGPGAGALWMRLGYTGPHRVRIDDEGYPIQPYGIEENPHSLLDVTDLVYVEPVNTGYSRPVGDAPLSQFLGINNDLRYLGNWLSTFVSRHNRWTSPKYLIGESYGTYRVSGLALELQNRHWMYVNGVVLVSPGTLGFWRYGPVGDANLLPYYAATAWYHKKLPADLQQRDLEEVLPEVEAYTVDSLIPALVRGGYLDAGKKQAIARKMSRYMGISETAILQHNLVVPMAFFWKELLRAEGYSIGRLDSRYLGIDRTVAGDGPDYAAENTSWQHTFTPANNYYVKNYLNYHTDLEYYVAGHASWNRFALENKTGESLRQAMAMNPFLHVLVQSGYYDGATDYFNAQYNLWQMDPSGKLKARMDWKGYRSGHMMYLRKDDLKTANDDLRAFISKTLPGEGVPAKYNVD